MAWAEQLQLHLDHQFAIPLAFNGADVADVDILLAHQVSHFIQQAGPVIDVKRKEG